MTGVMPLLADKLNVLADSTTKSPNGALGLLVVFVLAVVVVVLFRSMTGHLRKVDRMKLDDDQARATASNVVSPQSAPHDKS